MNNAKIGRKISEKKMLGGFGLFKPLVSIPLVLALGLNIELQASQADTQTFDFSANQTRTENIGVPSGNTFINFNGLNGVLQGTIKMLGGQATINIADFASGTIKGNVFTMPEYGGSASIAFASGISAKMLILEGDINEFANITFDNNGNSYSYNNDLILSGSSSTTRIFDTTTIDVSSGLSFTFLNDYNILVNNVVNNKNFRISFEGTYGIFSGDIVTDPFGTTDIYISNSGIINGSLYSGGGNTRINYLGGSNAKTLILNGNRNTVGRITLDTNSTSNTLVFANGETTISSALQVGANQDITFSIDMFGSAVFSDTLSTTDNGAIRVVFKDGDTSPKSLALNGNDNIISSIVVGPHSTSNVLSLNGETTTISNVNVGENGELAFNLISDSTLNFNLNVSSYGSAIFNLEKEGAGHTRFNIIGDLLNVGENAFNLYSSITDFRYGSDGLIFSNGRNIINFASTSGSTLNWQNSNGELKDIVTTNGETQINFTNDGEISGGVVTKSGNTSINFTKSGSIRGEISTSNGATMINIGGSGEINGALITEDAGFTFVHFGEGNGAKTLTLNEGGNTITEITLDSDSTSNSIILNKGVTTISGDKINVYDRQALNFDLNNESSLIFNGSLVTDTNGRTSVNYGATSDAKSLTLNEGGNTITSITLGANSTSNTLVLNKGNTTITSGVNVDASQGLAFNLNNESNLVFNGALTTNAGGTTTISFGGGSDTKSLTLNESGNTITSITLGANSTSNTLGVYKGVTTIVGNVNVGASQALNFDLNNESSLIFNGALTADASGITGVSFGATSDVKSLALNEGGNTITLIALWENSTSNILELHKGVTTIVGNVNVGASQALNFDLNNESSLVFNGILATDTNGRTSVSFGATSDAKSLTLNEGGNTITSITLGANSTSNTLVLNKGETTIASGVNVGANQGLAFNLNNASSLVFNGALNTDTDGTTSVIFGGSSDTKTLTLNEGNNTITSITLTPNSTSNSLVLNDASLSVLSPVNVGSNQDLVFYLNGNSSAYLNTLTTNNNGNTSIRFGDGEEHKSLEFFVGKSTLSSITLGENSTQNSLFFQENEVGLSVSNKLNIGEKQDLSFYLCNNTELFFENGIDILGSGQVFFDFSVKAEESVAVTLDGAFSNSGTISFYLTTKELYLKYGDNGLAFSSGTNIINFANTSGSTTLNWQNSSGDIKDIVTSGGNTLISFASNGTISGGVGTTSNGESTIAIADNTTATILGNINTSGGTTNINFIGNGTLSSSINTSDTGNTKIKIVGNNAYAVISDNITTSGVIDQTSSSTRLTKNGDSTQATTSVSFSGNGGALVLKGNNNSISDVSFGNGNYVLSLAEPTTKNGEEAREERRKLVIDTLNTSGGTLTLGTQINAQEADAFVINAIAGDKQGKYHFGIVVEDGTQLEDIVKVKLASVVNNDADIEFESKSNFIVGFTEAQAEIQKVNEGAYTSYYILKAQGDNVSLAEQAVTATAFTLNYDLYMANLNSLNRRMGELRENAHSQGVWARVFNGGLSNDFGLGSKTNYTTIQAGYDYAFGFEGANNYLGVALSYALSLSSVNSKAEDAMAGVRSLDNIYSNAVEVALYNSYVSDSGWYNDSIAKFSYIMSSFDIQANGSNIQNRTISSNTTNYAFTLSDEVGYAFRLGELSEWSITPQAELTFGYFNQSDFKQTLQEHYLDSKANSILTLRTRVGSAFAYDFRAFTQKSGFNASLYAGVFYEYDYVSGGDISMTTDVGVHSNHFSNLESDNRVVMNVGTNMTIQDNTRLYVDFEKSFVGKINTDYQVNLGVRYSFGENGGYVSAIEKAGYKAPLKVENSNEAEAETEEEDEEEGGTEE